jgi:hypothetical protein
LYNTSLTFGPDGALLGKHRKIHLFDIDVPGKITFRESDTLSPGNALTIVDTGTSPSLHVPRCAHFESQNLDGSVWAFAMTCVLLP